ncbi:MAG: DUF3883 domain-containing protein [Bacteroidota bacterium]
MRIFNYSHIKYVEILAFYKILYSVKQFPREPQIDIEKSVQVEYSLGGKLPVKKGLDIALDQHAIQVENDRLNLTSLGEALVSINDSNEPNHLVLQRIIYQILKKNKFPWIVFYNSKSSTFRMSIPANWELILDNSGLLDLDDKQVVTWWKSLFKKYDIEKEKINKEIGNIGEKLSVQYENRRLSKSGFDPSVELSWAALLDDTIGFDIISINGLEYSGPEKNNIFIEVKASERKNIQSFRFFLTRNEWIMALKSPENYYFYCWSGVNIDGKFDAGPFCFQASKIFSLVPKDQSEEGKWEVCKMTLDLNQIKIN